MIVQTRHRKPYFGELFRIVVRNIRFGDIFFEKVLDKVAQFKRRHIRIRRQTVRIARF